MWRWPGSLPRRYLASFFRYRRPASYNGYKMRPRLCRPSKACEVDTPSPSLAMRHAPKRLLHNNLSHQRLTHTTHPAKNSAKPLPNGTPPRAISPHEARWPTVGVPSATTAQCPRLGSPILQHFGRFSRVFSPIPAGPKYHDDVDDVDDVTLIIAVTAAAAVVYETGNL